MLDRHFSDERLLAHLDGELSAFWRRLVDRHLRHCWSCRSRQAKIEAQIHSLTKAWDEPEVATPSWSRSARRRLSASLRLQEPVCSDRPSIAWWPAAAVGVVVCGLLAGLISWRFAVHPESLVERAHQFEDRLEAGPYHQRFRVELAEIAPVHVRRVSTLELWSEGPSRRHAVRWTEQGRIRFASYSINRPAPNRESPPLMSALANAGDIDALERAFLHWLESRRWEPVRLSRDSAVFISGGARLESRRLTGSPAPTIRLTARQRGGVATADFQLDIEEASGRPRMQRFRLSGPGRTFEVSLTAEVIERVQLASLSPTLFAPNPPPPSVIPAPPPLNALPPVKSERVAREVESLEQEVAALFALHEGGFCTNEALTVDNLPTGGLRVAGVVESDERLTELRRLLSGLPNVRIETLSAEAAGIPNPEPSLSRHSETSPSDPPLLEELVRNMESSMSRREARERSAEFANTVTEEAARLLNEAWELRRLRERFTPDRLGRLSPSSRWLLDRITQEHAAVIRQLAPQLAARLAPFGGDSKTEAVTASYADLFAAIEQLESGIRRGFAGGGNSPVSLSDITQAAAVADALARTWNGSIFADSPIRAATPASMTEERTRQ